MIEILEKHKRVRVGGVVFTIRQLSPSLFMDSKEIMPINNIIEAVNAEENAVGKIEENKDLIKDTMKVILLKGIVKVNHWFKTKNIDEVIDSIMDKPEIYNYLCVRILNHALGIKKKASSLFSLTENLRPLFSI